MSSKDDSTWHSRLEVYLRMASFDYAQWRWAPLELVPPRDHIYSYILLPPPVEYESSIGCSTFTLPSDYEPLYDIPADMDVEGGFE